MSSCKRQKCLLVSRRLCCSRVLVKDEGVLQVFEGPAKKIKLEYDVVVKKEPPTEPQMRLVQPNIEVKQENDVVTDAPNPWPYLDKWVKYKKMAGNSYVFECISCRPRKTEIKSHRTSKTNLKRHFLRRHPKATTEILEACKANIATGRGRYRNTSGASTDSSSSTPSKKQRQLSTGETFGIVAQSGGVLQSAVDKAIVFFVVDNMLPLKILDSDSFRNLMHTMNPTKEVPAGRTLGRRMVDTYQVMKDNLTSQLEPIKWVATTADCWTANKKRYLGMTVHWLDPDSRVRKHAVLSCERIMGRLTHDVLAQAIDKIHCQFGIENKVTLTTTDNAANFHKAFVQFQFTTDLDDVQEDREVPEEDNLLDELLAEETEDQRIELQFIPFDEMEDPSDESTVRLPALMKCGAHTFNLVATVDINETDMPQTFKRPYRAAIAKAKALWNQQGTSTVFADSLVQSICERLKVPNSTSWNSLYDSLTVLNKVLDEKKDILHSLMNQHRNNKGLVVFLQTDVDVMAEYTKVMAPVAIALDVIQGEKHGYLGCLIPTITVAKKMLINLKSDNTLRFCGPLVDSLLAGIDKRFSTIMEMEECVLAAAFHPKFRAIWMEEFEKAKVPQVIKMMEQKVEEFLLQEYMETASNSSNEEMETQDFFSSITQKKLDTGRRTHRSFKPKAVQIVNDWLEGHSTDSLSDPAFNHEKVLIDIFIRYNSAMPSSASVKRLFSLDKDINGAKRSLLSDDYFNMLMFMKGNMPLKLD